MADKIGNPLEQAAQSGMLGQRRPLMSSLNQERQGVAEHTPQSDKEKPKRVQKTLLFTPSRAKWLKVTAAQEGREMSDIVEEALATYEKMHS